MPLDVIVGTQWGDEGKGRITDLLAAKSNVVARFGGGDNAGHTVSVGDQIFKLHLIPSGIIHPHTTCLIGSGVVVNPAKLIDEIDQLSAAGIDVSPKRLQLSGAAHLITPAHLALDSAEEAQRGPEKLGTTKRGIGPAYTDKTARSGIRTESMRNPTLLGQMVRDQIERVGELLIKVYNIDPPDPDAAAKNYVQFAKRLLPYLSYTSGFAANALDRGEVVLAEGAQGTLLDLDHGTYPFVTSSHPITPGALLGLGVGATHLRRVIGVVKAFQTRVGEGPFPTELQDQIGDHLRGTGENVWDEFGTTTGRPRRCGWLDGVLLRYATRINGLTEIAITKLDILSGLNQIFIATAYKREGSRFDDLPEEPVRLDTFTPEYEKLGGWESEISELKEWDHLPVEAQRYVRRIEEMINLNASIISVGAERTQVIRR
ncbi:MAG: adenylosuccinate synthase [Anaerolineales bacterium]